MHVDLLIVHAAQLLTLAASGPRTGPALADLGLVEDGAVACRDGRIVAAGPTAEVLSQVDSVAETLDVRGRVVMPGFVDAHTHVVVVGRPGVPQPQHAAEGVHEGGARRRAAAVHADDEGLAAHAGANPT